MKPLHESEACTRWRLGLGATDPLPEGFEIPHQPAKDAGALAQFEALVFSQQPAQEPWKPVTDYSFEARKAIEGKHAELIRDVFQPTHVIDAGCGPDAVLVRLLRDLGVAARGFDVILHGSRRRGLPSYLAIADVAILPQALPIKALGKADLVICREVLEHLPVLDVRRAVTNLCRLSSRYIYVTTRFNPNPQHLLDVATSDDLDPTHITLLNQDFLRVLFVLEGFARRADLETQMDWQQKGRCLVYERAA